MFWPKRIVFCILAAFAVSSCGITPTAVVADANKQTAANITSLAFITDEIDDLALVVLNNFSESGLATDGRVETLSDDRLICPGISFVFSNVSPDRTSGSVTITFPDAGCTDGIKTNVRKGSVTLSWSGGKWYKAGSVLTFTFNNFSLNGVVITGTRTLTCTVFTFASAKIFNVTWTIAANHTLTWPDGTSSTFKVNKTKAWSHGGSGDVFRYTTGPAGDYSVTGTNRYGKEFSVSIQTMLMITTNCKKVSKNYMPIYGTEIITDISGGKTLNIDYGNLVCDGVYVLTVDNVQSVLVGKNDSSSD